MAQHALTEIQHLYKIEHLCDEAKLTTEERRPKRNELARPIMEAMKVWMETIPFSMRLKRSAGVTCGSFLS